MLRVGLTGGIGSGKSTVASLFENLGIPVIDADVIARELVAPGQPALAEIIVAFGTDVVDAEGRLDRPRLRALVLRDPDQRRRLETILHPRIRTAMERRAATHSAPYVLLVIPLLFEADQRDLVDRVLVVDAPSDRQRERVSARDGLPAAQIEALLAAQMDGAARRALADDVIDNSGDLAGLARQVAKLHDKYLALAIKP